MQQREYAKWCHSPWGCSLAKTISQKLRVLPVCLLPAGHPYAAVPCPWHWSLQWPNLPPGTLPRSGWPLCTRKRGWPPASSRPCGTVVEEGWLYKMVLVQLCRRIIAVFTEGSLITRDNQNQSSFLQCQKGERWIPKKNYISQWGHNFVVHTYILRWYFHYANSLTWSQPQQEVSSWFKEKEKRVLTFILMRTFIHF